MSHALLVNMAINLCFFKAELTSTTFFDVLISKFYRVINKCTPFRPFPRHFQHFLTFQVFGKIQAELHIHKNYEDDTNKILPVSTLGLKGAPPSGEIDLIIQFHF